MAFEIDFYAGSVIIITKKLVLRKFIMTKEYLRSSYGSKQRR